MHVLSGACKANRMKRKQSWTLPWMGEHIAGQRLSLGGAMTKFDSVCLLTNYIMSAVNPQTTNMDSRVSDSSSFLFQRGGIPGSIGSFP